MPDIATPTQGITTINKVLLALRRIDAESTYQDLAEIAELSEQVTSQALSSSRDLGLTKSAGERGLYELTDIGKEYALNLSYDELEEASEVLKKSILLNNKWNEIISYLDNQKDIPFDPFDLIRFIEKKLGKSWSRTMRRRMKTSYSTILTAANLLNIKDGKALSLYHSDSDIVKQNGQSVSRPKIGNDWNDEYAILETNEFQFRVKKDIQVLDFAKLQFISWIEYIKTTIEP